MRTIQVEIRGTDAAFEGLLTKGLVQKGEEAEVIYNARLQIAEQYAELGAAVYRGGTWPLYFLWNDNCSSGRSTEQSGSKGTRIQCGSLLAEAFA
ncbi:MAG TPA: hypothetical protein VNJ12_03265 [Candidatus Dormibacteraeota bacterium]|nr:hypothetical protein [Candidatus Dormibacteraeota bacterium]